MLACGFVGYDTGPGNFDWHVFIAKLSCWFIGIRMKNEAIRDASLYRYDLYITICDRPVYLSQGRDILYTVICSFMKVLEFNMYTVHLDSLGIIHNFQCIDISADISSLEIIKAGPFLTLPLSIYITKIF
jgi:hypothetical protein